MRRGQPDPLERAVTLAERLHHQVVATDTDWPVVVALAGELAMLARGRTWLTARPAPSLTGSDVETAFDLVELLHELVTARDTDWAAIATAAAALAALADR